MDFEKQVVHAVLKKEIILEEYQVAKKIHECEDVEECFADSFSHLAAELERIDVLIQSQLHRIQKVFSSADSYRGLYINEHEVKSQFKKPIGQPWWSAINGEFDSSKVDLVNYETQQNISRRVIASEALGIRLMLVDLVKIFELTQQDKDIILLALAPQIDRRYELMFAYLQDNLTQKYLSVDLLLNLLGQTPNGRLKVRQQIKSDSNLLKHNLIELKDEPAQQTGGFLSKMVRLPSRVVEYLLDAQYCDTLSYPLCELVDLETTADELNPHPISKNKVIALAQYLQKSPKNNLIHLEGRSGSGRLNAAKFIAKHQHNKIMKIDVLLLCHLPNDEFVETFRLVIREALLQNAGLYFELFDSLLGDDQSEKYQLFCKAILPFTGVIFLAGDHSWFAKSSLPEKYFFQIKLNDLSSLQRMALWQRMLAKTSSNYSSDALLHIADRFHFTQGQIADAIATAKQISSSESVETSKIPINVLYRACRLNTNRKLSTLAKRISPKYEWDDIILTKDNQEQLRQLHDTVQHSAKVYDEWGFADKLSLGKGINALFTGPPGTGKTMAAEIIAKSLGLELYKIDLSLVVSKYIGETEKNLSRIFLEAETSSAILFFDEADALFGKRTDIKNSHDRYANIEVAYLLQKMEEYNGITILATNLRKNMDEAFIRRLAFIIRFPFPEKLERQNIWRSIWPKSAPLSSDIDFEFLAEQFKLAGGNIKNIALAASFLAAEDQTDVSMKHLIKSTKREFEKQGRACVRADFGKYESLM